ncbi:MAG TPA: STAS domain-containing protein [Candidatus Aquicultor sp.]|jgi:anti-anti-sigma factor
MAERKMPRHQAHQIETNVKFDFERIGDTLIVHLSGEADLLGSSKIRQALTRKLNDVNRIIFDLSDLDFADSYFLRFLIKLRKQLGGVSSVVIENAKPNVARIFEVTGLDKLFMSSDENQEPEIN